MKSIEYSFICVLVLLLLSCPNPKPEPPTFNEVKLGHLTINPSIIDVSIPTKIEYHLTIKKEIDSTARDIYLASVDSLGKIKISAFKLYNDGTHGDSIPNDSVFSRIQEQYFDEVATIFQTAITKINNNYYHSNTVVLNVLIPVENESFQQILNNIEKISDSVDVWLASDSVTVAQEKILNFLNNDAFVEFAELSDDSFTITTHFKNGIGFLINTSPPGALDRPYVSESLLAMPQTAGEEEGFVACGDYEIQQIEQILTNTPFKREILKGSEMDVKSLKSIYNFGIISIYTHGGTYVKEKKHWYSKAKMGIYLLTGQNVHSNDGNEYKNLLQAKQLYIHKGNKRRVYALTDEFILNLQNDFPNSLVVLSACNSLKNETMANAFLGKGASTFFGWQRKASGCGAAHIKKLLFKEMVENRKTTGEAYNSIPHEDPLDLHWYTRRAKFLMRGNDNIVIFSPSSFFSWAYNSGGTEYDVGRSIVEDQEGNSILTGVFRGTAIFSAEGEKETKLTSYGDQDIFIAKYSNYGSLIWAKQAGGMTSDSGLKIASDKSNNSVVTGFFSNTAFFGKDEPNETRLISQGSYDIFIAKYDPFGKLVWARQTHDITTIFPFDFIDITIDNSDNIIVSGWFIGKATFGRGEPNETKLSSSTEDIFLAKYNSSGELVWAKKAGGSGFDVGHGVITDNENNIILTGHFYRVATFGAGEQNETRLVGPGGPCDIFIAKYNLFGELQWAKKAGGSYCDIAYAITLDELNNAIIAGYFGGGTATFGEGETNETKLTSYRDDMFIAKYDPSGQLIWAKQAGGTARVGEDGLEITCDNLGGIIIIGRFENTALFDKNGPNETKLTSYGNTDIFIAKYNTLGQLIWIKQAGGEQKDLGYGIATDDLDNIFITGSFANSAKFDDTSLTSKGKCDIFISKITKEYFILNSPSIN